MIELQNVSKTYDYKKSVGFLKKEHVKVKAVEDISFKVDEGEKIGLIGLNGAGKSTTIKKFDGVTTIGLLLTLVIIFTFQGDMIVKHPLYVVLIAVPLILQNVISFSLTYFVSKISKLPHEIAAPASLIAASDFFELSVAVGIALFGVDSPVVLASTVGVLTEVPVMLLLVRIVNNTKSSFPSLERVK